MSTCKYHYFRMYLVEMLEGGPQHWGLVARTAVQRANLGLAVTAKFPKLPERATNAASFGHTNAENLSAPVGFAP